MINRESLAEQVYMVLRDKIIRGQLKSGQRLLEDDITKEFGVSKTPVRQALSWLEKDGLLRGVKGHSKEVAALSIEEAEEIYEVRSALEGLAARSLAELPEREGVLETIEQIHEEARSALAKENFGVVLLKDREFHDTLVSCSSNKVMKETMQNLKCRIMLLQVTYLNPGEGLKISLKEHDEVIQAIKQGDGDSAEEAMKKHIFRIIRDKFFITRA